MTDDPTRATAAAVFVLHHTSTDGSTEIEHRDGVPWHEAPRPRRWHRCQAQTRGWINYFTAVERCACGAIRLDGHRWSEKNNRA